MVAHLFTSAHHGLLRRADIPVYAGADEPLLGKAINASYVSQQQTVSVLFTLLLVPKPPIAHSPWAVPNL